MNNLPLVSIIINNYNYGRFLGAAIDSALAQSYAQTEVLVVDDGSTDDSRAIMAAYGARITPVLKANGGQASAFNAGFASCRGELVIFLDADDLLSENAAACVVQAFNAAPDAVRVQWRLAVVDGGGMATGETKPPRARPLPAGDLRLATLRYGDDIAWLPTSGNAFAATMLRQILPMPETPYRICADYYLSNLSPLYGSVLALDHLNQSVQNQSLGSYRVHGTNNYQKARLDLDQLQALLARTATTHHHVAAHAAQHGLVKSVAAAQYAVARDSLIFPANQLICQRLVPDWRAPDNATVGSLARRGVAAAWRRSDLTFTLRLLYAVWFCLVAVAPRRALPWLAEQLFFPDARGKWFGGWLPLRLPIRRVRLEPRSRV